MRAASKRVGYWFPSTATIQTGWAKQKIFLNGQELRMFRPRVKRPSVRIL